MNAKKNKTGILTFHKSINYGSVLQAWALQQTLLKMNKNVEIIDYEPKIYNRLYGVFRKEWTIKNILYNIKRLPIAGMIKRQIALFSEFRKSNLKTTNKTFHSVEEFEHDKSDYQYLITGSDQVWNIHAYDCDDIFFLPFDFEGKKIAYAVSVNDTDFSESKCDERLQKQLRDYAAISCREKSGAVKIAEFINADNIFTALDPTLLLEKEDYNHICSGKLIHTKYIFLYSVWEGSDAISIAKQYSRLFHMPICTILTKKDFRSILRMEMNGIKIQKFYTSPGDFLSLIRYADFVITDSFHGTAFSIIFERQFACINQRVQGNGRNSTCLKNDERLMNILFELGLNDRLISISESHKLNNMKAINYIEVTSIRMSLAKLSSTWLYNALGMAEK